MSLHADEAISHTDDMYISHYVFAGLDPDINPDEEEEKRRRITQVLELQNTLDGKFVDFCPLYLPCLDTHSDFSAFKMIIPFHTAPVSI